MRHIVAEHDLELNGVYCRRHYVDYSKYHYWVPFQHSKHHTPPCDRGAGDGNTNRPPGAVAGANAAGMTVLDLLTDPSLLRDANACFVNVRQAPSAYDPLLSADGKPALDLNIDIMSRIRESMETYYYDPSRYASYLEQLGIEYPGLKAAKTPKKWL